MGVPMNHDSMRRGLIGVLAATSLTLTAACSGVGHDSDSEAEHERDAAAAAGLKAMPQNALEKYMMIAGTDPDEAAKESKESATIGEQFAEARTAPGVVDSGAYTAAFNQIKNLPIAGGSWADVTKVPYNSDDPRYRDYYSNSSGGSGFVTGRITGLAADSADHVYAAGADGGAWRSTTGGG